MEYMDPFLALKSQVSAAYILPGPVSPCSAAVPDQSPVLYAHSETSFEVFQSCLQMTYRTVRPHVFPHLNIPNCKAILWIRFGGRYMQSQGVGELGADL